MMRRYITALMLACCIGGYGQEKKQVTFVPPFDFPLTLSGNFGVFASRMVRDMYLMSVITMAIQRSTAI